MKQICRLSRMQKSLYLLIIAALFKHKNKWIMQVFAATLRSICCLWRRGGCARGVVNLRHEKEEQRDTRRRQMPLLTELSTMGEAVLDNS